MALRTINTRVVVSAALGLIAGAALTTSTADAAEILVVANSGAPAVATEFNAQIPQHNFTAFNAGNNAPSLDMLNMYDGVLLFENGLFANSVNVGNAIGAWYEQGGGCVLIGTFYWQDRSNNPNYLDNFTWACSRPTT